MDSGGVISVEDAVSIVTRAGLARFKPKRVGPDYRPQHSREILISGTRAQCDANLERVTAMIATGKIKNATLADVRICITDEEVNIWRLK